MQRFSNKLAVLAILGAPALSFAAVDADSLADIASAGADVATVGAAVFAVMVGIKLVKWIRRAL